MPTPLRRTLLAAAALLLLASGACSHAGDLADQPATEPEQTPADEAGGPTPAPEQPTGKPPPPVFEGKLWADRPVVDLTFDLTDGLDTVTGTETVVFRPDMRACEVVFRQWANKPEAVELGNESRITAAAVDGEEVEPRFEAAGSPDTEQRTLARLALPDCLRPGEKVTVELEFEVTVGQGSRERLGYNDDLIWLATAYPLLAWERERGWAENPAVDQFGETVTSEVFELRELEVLVPEEYSVLGTGRRVGRDDGPEDGTAIERFHAEAVRDVAVTAGEMEVATRKLDNGVVVHVGGQPENLQASLDRWAEENIRAIRELRRLLGPYPYTDLWVSVLPDCPSGVEFPGAVQYHDYGARNPAFEAVVSHEVAHMWFYGLVGNNQGMHPWLDESFASWAERLVNDQLGPSRLPALQVVKNEVGRSMEWYSRPRNRSAYGYGVYEQGMEMFFRARRQAGQQRFDRLVRRYIRANAHEIATPDDVRRAFRPAPEVVDVLERYGALR